MNVERINKLADAIETHAEPDLGFNMSFFNVTIDDDEDASVIDRSGHDCGTVACIAGWTCVVFSDDLPSGVYGGFGPAAWLLGIEGSNLADDLFFMNNAPHEVSMYHVSSEQAVRTLRHLAKTGVVDWSV